MKPKVLCTHHIPKKGLFLLEKEFEIEFLNENLSINDQLEEKLPKIHYLIPLLSIQITRHHMELAPNLKGIANYAVGYNNIDIEAAKEFDIKVTNTPDVLTNATADLVWALILAVTRRIVEGDAICRRNEFPGWLPEYLLGYEVTGKTLGIVGAGRIGSAVGKRGLGFDMKIIYFSRSRRPDLEENYGFIPYYSLQELLRDADIISLNVPYTKETHHLISKKELKLMKSSSYLINTTRGKVINESDLIEALETRLIAGAGLDVFYEEPFISERMRKLSNIVMTPHIGSATTNARNAMAVMVAKNIIAIEVGDTPPNLIPEFEK